MQRHVSIRPPEKDLRHLWQHQRLITSKLETTDGKEVTVLSPGTPNADGGPDFVDACLRIGGVLYRGDVELHTNYDEWNQHAHNRDPKYNKVILHVVLNGKRQAHPLSTKSRRFLPVLVLDTYLSGSSDAVIAESRNNEQTGNQPKLHCQATNASVDGTYIRDWLCKLAVERVELKVRRCEERLKELIDEQRLSINEPSRTYGKIPFGLNLEELPPIVSTYSQREYSKSHLWNQLLYEGVMGALGYSKNQEAFQKLAWNLPLRSFVRLLSNVPRDQRLMSMEAILFGVSGLLQQHRKEHDRQSRKRLRELTRRWKEHRLLYHGEMLTEAEWQFFRLRPENFPTVRLAGAARLIPLFLEGDVFKSIIQIVKTAEGEKRAPLKALKSLFLVASDEFWRNHYCFGGQSKVNVKKLVGDHRAGDIVLNVVTPVCLLYARVFRDKDVRSGILRILEQFPSSGENVVTRTIEHELLREKIPIDSAILHQGALQLYSSYCVVRRCTECAVGKVVFGERSDEGNQI